MIELYPHKYGEYVKIPIKELRKNSLNYLINKKLEELYQLLKKYKEIKGD